MGADLSSKNRKYPLSTLFGFTAACAVILAVAAPLVRLVLREHLGLGTLIAATIIAACATSFLGVLIGLLHCRQPMGCLLGGLVGGILGPLAGALCLIPITSGYQFIGISMGGAVLLVGIGAFIRLTQGDGDMTLQSDLFDEEPSEAEVIDEEQLQRDTP